jgi:hypothetical protein
MGQKNAAVERAAILKVEIPASLKQRIKVYAAETRQTLKQVVESAVRAYCK